MNYRQIQTKFWTDSYISELSPEEKLFFIYLLTNDKVNLCGIYELSDRRICFDFNIDFNQLEKLKQRMEKDQKFTFYKNWIYILNFSKYNSFSPSENILKAFIKEFNSIPPEICNYFFNELKLPYSLSENYKEIVVIGYCNGNGNGNGGIDTLGGRVGGRVGFEARSIKEEIDLDEISEKI